MGHQDQEKTQPLSKPRPNMTAHRQRAGTWGPRLLRHPPCAPEWRPLQPSSFTSMPASCPFTGAPSLTRPSVASEQAPVRLCACVAQRSPSRTRHRSVPVVCAVSSLPILWPASPGHLRFRFMDSYPNTAKHLSFFLLWLGFWGLVREIFSLCKGLINRHFL